MLKISGSNGVTLPIRQINFTVVSCWPSNLFQAEVLPCEEGESSSSSCCGSDVVPPSISSVSIDEPLQNLFSKFMH